MTLPSLPISFSDDVVTDPAASATSGSFCTSVRSDCGIVGGSTLVPLALSKAAFPVMTTSAFWYEPVKIVWKPALIVSVRM